MRKTKRCDAVWLDTARMRIRTCLRLRRHTGEHVDEHGSWEGPTTDDDDTEADVL